MSPTNEKEITETEAENCIATKPLVYIFEASSLDIGRGSQKFSLFLSSSSLFVLHVCVAIRALVQLPFLDVVGLVFVLDQAHFHVLLSLSDGLLLLLGLGLGGEVDGVAPGLDDRGRADLEALLEAPRGGQHEVDGVSGDHDHGGRADEEPEGLAPSGVVVGLGVLDGLVLDEVEDEDELKFKCMPFW